MADKPWKVAERQVAAVIGGERVPINGRQRGSAPDIDHEWLAVEVKHTGQFPKKWAEAFSQAVASKVKAEINGKVKLPVVIIKPHRCNARNSYIMMQLGDFVDWFGEVPREALKENPGAVFDRLDEGVKS